MPRKSIQLRRRQPETAITPWTMEHPLVTIQREMNRAFSHFLQGTDFWTAVSGDSERAMFFPRIDVQESDKEIDVQAELPGLDQKDVRVSVTKNALVIQGDKKETREEKAKGRSQIERLWGSFYRSIPLTSEIDVSKADAHFTNGVILIRLPKIAQADTEAKDIPVRS